MRVPSSGCSAPSASDPGEPDARCWPCAPVVEPIDAWRTSAVAPRRIVEARNINTRSRRASPSSVGRVPAFPLELRRRSGSCTTTSRRSAESRRAALLADDLDVVVGYRRAGDALEVHDRLVVIGERLGLTAPRGREPVTRFTPTPPGESRLAFGLERDGESIRPGAGRIRVGAAADGCSHDVPEASADEHR